MVPGSGVLAGPMCSRPRGTLFPLEALLIGMGPTFSLSEAQSPPKPGVGLLFLVASVCLSWRGGGLPELASGQEAADGLQLSHQPMLIGAGPAPCLRAGHRSTPKAPGAWARTLMTQVESRESWVWLI